MDLIMGEISGIEKECFIEAYFMPLKLDLGIQFGNMQKMKISQKNMQKN